MLATLLTALGLYGVLTFSVARRAREIGAASFGFSRLISSLLFGVTPNSVTTLAGVSAGLIAVALLACYIPARRATKVDPMVALRYE